MDEQKKILLIDDEINLQQLVKVVLGTKGYNVTTADNGKDGLEKLESANPDLIILDMNMPVMGGVEFYQKICDAWSQPKYPILILTARANMEEFFKGMDVDGFMAKPFEIDDLLAEVRRIIEKRSAGAARTAKIRDTNQPANICVAETDTATCNKIGAALLSAGYVVHLVRSGTEAIEHIFTIVPEVAVISFALGDIPGDAVITKLKKMPKTQDVKFILYTEDTPEKAIVAQSMIKKEGIEFVRFVKYQNVEDILLAIDEVLKPNR
ncbi:MAG: response regulator [Candidatus Omnitrophica bacterium]|nr:response regulator [Candidatus Omnitrophota bacterium]